ncbi:putative adenine phosphoribosyltransferase [Seiridium cardinale]|uniref:adenine phosphoribosyltransferase n=1 Tax=Seiridium cardinale TaxID=138064 RepID=A0ABR2XV32_9PEZI
MSAPVTSDSATDSVATNPYQPGITASTVLDAPRREPPAAAAGAPQLPGQPLTSDREATKKRVLAALRNFPDFPIPGIDFIDILPIFQDPKTFDSLLQVLETQIQETLGSTPDVIVGLDARGFLFGPSLALRLNCSFVPVRKKGKVPGPTVTASYEKEYGTDYFQMQSDAIKPGQKVLVVDDIIATGGSAAAAGSLIKQLGGSLVGYLFIIEISPLKGREKLGDYPVMALLDAAA